MKDRKIVPFERRRSSGWVKPHEPPRRKPTGRMPSRRSDRQASVGLAYPLIFFLIGIAAVLASQYGPSVLHLFARGDTISAGAITVIDGDTIRVAGMPNSVRLVGINAPETIEARCPAEAELGRQATNRLRSIVVAGDLSLAIVACSCRPCRLGRTRLRLQCRHHRSHQWPADDNGSLRGCR